MKKFIISLLLVSVCLNLIFLARAEAGPFFGGPIEKSPSVFYYGWKGCYIGMLGGLSTGYLDMVGDKGDSDKEKSKTMLRHLGYGAIGGTFVGLAIGTYELTQDYAGTGAVVLRDMQLGSLMGTFVGLASGLISYSESDNWDDVGKGAAWGNLGGIVLGGLFGFIEAPKVLRETKAMPNWVPYVSVDLKNNGEKSYPFYTVNFKPVKF